MARGRTSQRRPRLPHSGEFAALWQGELASAAGDQLAKTAVALVVYDRTGSPAATGAAYAATFFAPLVTGVLLAGLADRYRRRGLMVTCCLVQAACIAAVAIPGTPLWLLVAGVVAVSGVQTLFKAAQGPVIHQVLGDHLAALHGPRADDGQRQVYNAAGRARVGMVRELAQVAGLAGGAAVVLSLGSTAALLIDAATFLIAAALLRWRLTDRPPNGDRPVGRSALAGLLQQQRQMWGMLRRPVVRVLFLLLALVGLTNAPDAVAVPLVAEIGSPQWVLGLILAADGIGVAAGEAWIARQPGARVSRAIGPLSVLSMAAMAAFWIRPSAAVVVVVLLVISGIGGAYFQPVLSQLTDRVDADITGATNGLMNAVLRASQGVGALTAGALAEGFSAVMAVAVLGSLGVLLTGACALRWRQLMHPPQVRRSADT
jgi:MFS family permease